MARYRQAGYPENNGLTETNVLLRRHNDPLVVAAMEEWWQEFLSGAPRDQLSFGYVLWRQRLPYAVMEESTRFTNDHDFARPHMPKGTCTPAQCFRRELRIGVEAGVLSAAWPGLKSVRQPDPVLTKDCGGVTDFRPSSPE
jgi:hypothetical protein